MSGSLKEDWERRWGSGFFEAIPAEMEANPKTAQGQATLKLLEGYGKGDKVLEAGCGLGVWAFLFEQMGFESYGVDFSEVAMKEATEYAREHDLSSKFSLGDVRALPFQSDCFDVIVSYGVIEHFNDSKSAVREFYRVLRPGGACLVTTPNPFNFHRLIGRHILNITKSTRLGYVGKENDYTPKALARILKELGFQEVTCGILDEGLLFGMFWQFIPLVRRPLYHLLQKTSLFMERRQLLIGTGSYAIGYKY